MKRALMIFMAILLVVSLSGVASKIPNPNTVIELTTGTVPTLDPSWCYDTRSGEIIFQTYDNLIQYDGTSITRFLPMLSTNVPNEKDGTILDNGKTYVFHIRQGVYFHNGDILTPQDVVYSLERTVIFDRAGGPQWMLDEPLLPKINGAYVDDIKDWAVKLAGVNSWSDLFIKGTKTPKNDKYKQALIDAFKLLDRDFEIKGNDVIIHLPHVYPPFLFIIAHGANWSAIMDKKWAIEHKAWPGTAATWWLYNNPTREEDPLYSVENGTGPFIVDHWIKGREVALKRFDKYWAGKAKILHVIIKEVNEFTTRKLMLARGDADMISVPDQFLQQVESIPGVKIFKNLPALHMDALIMNFNVQGKKNPYIGSGKLDGNGIPPNFFSDINVRKAFSYMFPYQKFIKEAAMGYGIQPNGPIPKGMLGYNPDGPKYKFDLVKATEYFKKAFGGKLWKTGFKMTIGYISGEEPIAEEMLAYYAKEINPKFDIKYQGFLWASFLPAFEEGKLPMYFAGWVADYPGPNDFVQPFLGSNGAYSGSSGKNFKELAVEKFDPLINKAMEETNPEKRAQYYYELQKICYEEAINIWDLQPLGVHVQRSWIHGWYYNPMRPGFPPSNSADFFRIWKGYE